MAYLEDDNFMNFVASESYVSPQERAWEKWVAKCEKILGHDLDGDNSDAAKAAGTADGYSMDDAHDAFEVGLTAEQYAEEVRTGVLQEPKMKHQSDYEDDYHRYHEQLWEAGNEPDIYDGE